MPFAPRHAKVECMKAAASMLAAQLHRNPKLLPSADQADVSYENRSRPIRPSRARRRRRG
jgi:hypothetical protein